MVKSINTLIHSCEVDTGIGKWYNCKMQSISDMVSKKSEELKDTKKIGSERSYIIGQIMEELEKDRLVKPFYIKNGKVISLRKNNVVAISSRLSYLKNNQDLYYILSVCKQSKTTFSQLFWYLTKTSKI